MLTSARTRRTASAAPRVLILKWRSCAQAGGREGALSSARLGLRAGPPLRGWGPSARVRAWARAAVGSYGEGAGEAWGSGCVGVRRGGEAWVCAVAGSQAREARHAGVRAREAPLLATYPRAHLPTCPLAGYPARPTCPLSDLPYLPPGPTCLRAHSPARTRGMTRGARPRRRASCTTAGLSGRV